MNGAKLSKVDIIQGKDSVRRFFVEEWGGEVELRPLTEGQYAQIEAIRASGMKMRGQPVFDSRGNVDRIATGKNLQMEIDIEESFRTDFEADCTAVAYSLSSNEETWTVDEVMRLRPVGVVTKIAQEVYRITGVSPQRMEELRSFRGQPRRTRNRLATDHGASPSADAGGANPATEDVSNHGGSAADS